MQAVEELYVAFAPNRRGQPISYCGHCISDEEASVLQRTPLRELTAGDLERYTFKAMGTWGEEADLRHFLPRILELFATGEQNDHSVIAYLEILAGQQGEPAMVQMAKLVDAVLLSGLDDFFHREVDGWIRTGLPGLKLEAALAATADADAAGWYGQALEIIAAYHHPG
ncbi:hypothetical protein [Actinoplanes solisilvae]|uniref:hypothetical protein n=1 Tax=Actinoplanes solisilvae TaxID=2486853 RepID=UPI000FDB51FD|nr:hypothetical protein [Actinoplanes solisilvae]